VVCFHHGVKKLHGKIRVKFRLLFKRKMLRFGSKKYGFETALLQDFQKLKKMNPKVVRDLI
jgi:hypothetical protein